MIKVYYWQAADRIVAIYSGCIINIFNENYEHPKWKTKSMIFDIEHTRYRVNKMKTLVYLGEL